MLILRGRRALFVGEQAPLPQQTNRGFAFAPVIGLQHFERSGPGGLLHATYLAKRQGGHLLRPALPQAVAEHRQRRGAFPSDQIPHGRPPLLWSATE